SRPSKKDGRDAHPTIIIKIVSYLIGDPKYKYLLISVMIHSLATQAAYAAPWGVRNVGIYGQPNMVATQPFRCSENCCRNNHCLLLTA
ncbi:hypothetical protein QUB56_20315, partial [Microcoleus sp. AR_TQ3_B6]|uniref:hypothetical protein n=1 Tax=Microcoleus sp. AR_TQ3_B6 TaxID=3055284 RepID=UPI002FD0F6D5